MAKQFLLIFLLVSIMAYSQEQFPIYFESGKYELAKNEIKTLENWIQDNKTSKIIGAYGFCDEDGSVQYNEVLAGKRVDFVYSILKEKIKIREDFKTHTFGKLHNQVAEKAKNRKVSLFFLKEKDLEKENQILGMQPILPEPVIPEPSQPQVVEIKKEPIVFPDRVSIPNPNGSNTELPLDVVFMETMSKAGVGEKLKIKNLNFVLNSFAILNESRPKLYELLAVMQSNPNLKISIQGHLCCTTADSKDLSTQRSRAIYKFLEFNDIPKTRMSYKGFGVTQPIYPIPEKNEEERIANRRVEIEIIEK